MSYRELHKDEGHGARYEAFFEQPWQTWVRAREQEILADVLERHFQGRDIHLLDFACGTGRILEFLEDRVTTSVGVDVSSSMLEFAGPKLSRTDLMEADITQDPEHPLTGRRFNLITAFRFFLNAEPLLRQQALHALVELLDEDGIIVFNNHGTANSPYIKLLSYYAKLKQAMFNSMSICEMRDLVEREALEIIELHPASLAARRLGLPPSACRAIENIGIRFEKLHPLFDDQVAVCRRTA